MRKSEGGKDEKVFVVFAETLNNLLYQGSLSAVKLQTITNRTKRQLNLSNSKGGGK